MNSCTSTELSACAPPFRMFIMGTGSVMRGRVARILREIFVERLLGRGRGGARGGHRNGEDGVGAEIRFVRRAVGVDHAACRGRADRRRPCPRRLWRFRRSRGRRLSARPCQDSAICRRRAIRWLRARRWRRRREQRRGRSAAFEANVRFDCGIAARIENLAAVNSDDLRGHDSSPTWNCMLNVHPC